MYVAWVVGWWDGDDDDEEDGNENEKDDDENDTSPMYELFSINTLEKVQLYISRGQWCNHHLPV